MRKIKKIFLLILTFMMLLAFAIPTQATTIKTTPLKSIAINKTQLSMNVGEKVTLVLKYNPSNTTSEKKASWTSSNTSVAQVVKGKVSTRRAGTTTITATVDGKKAYCKITVKAPITKIVLSRTSVSINEGKGAGIITTYWPSNTTDSKKITWISSNNSIATVSKGTIYGKKAGKCVVTAKMGTKTAKVNVTVKAVPAKYVSVNQCYTKLNQYRKNAKVGTLKRDANLERIAKTRAKEIAVKFSHTRPNGKRGIDLIKGNLYKGENIAYGQENCSEVMSAWYASKEHKANMIKKPYTKVGTAGYMYRGIIYWVQVFSS